MIFIEFKILLQMYEFSIKKASSLERKNQHWGFRDKTGARFNKNGSLFL